MDINRFYANKMKQATLAFILYLYYYVNKLCEWNLQLKSQKMKINQKDFEKKTF